jgi:hypothetical protein
MSAQSTLPIMTTVSTSSLETPSASAGIQTEPLRRADGAIQPFANTRQPFAAFKETNPSSGAWRVRITSRHDTTAVLYPNAIRLQARAVSAEGKSSFTWTNATDARPGEPKRLQFVVHVNDGEPATIEILPAANSFSAVTPTPMKFCWPAA